MLSALLCLPTLLCSRAEPNADDQGAKQRTEITNQLIINLFDIYVITTNPQWVISSSSFLTVALISFFNTNTCMSYLLLLPQGSFFFKAEKTNGGGCELVFKITHFEN